MADLRNYVLLVDKQGKEVLPVTDGKAVFVGDGSVKLNDQLTSLEGQISTNAGEIARVENSVLEAYKLEVEGKLNDKANATEVTEAINGVKATAEGADAKANKNASDLAEYKIEVEGLLTGKSNEGHTHEEYALGNEVEEVRGLVNANTSAIATKVEQSAFDSYKEEVTGALANKADATHDHEEYALKAEMGAVSGLATSAKDTVVNAINEVKGMADANASAVATKVETETFNTYKGEVDGKIALKADQTALEELGGQLEGCIRFRTVEIDSFTLA